MLKIISLTAILLTAISGCSKKPDASQAAAVISAGSSKTPSGTETPLTARENAVAPEVNPPGDIPDTQAFVTYSNGVGMYSLEVPEGWARTENGSSVSFVSKFDGVKADVTPVAAAPTVISVRTQVAKTIQSQGRAVRISGVTEEKVPGGNAIVVKYTSNSEPNAVTNKQVRLENETYIFFRNGREAMLTMWAPEGADNVDQWQRMAKSFRLK